MKPKIIVLLVATAALIAKLYCAATTIGTSDVALFWKFSRTIHSEGLLAMYRQTEFFNHTPVVGWFSEAALVLSGGQQQRFALLLRLPPILADFLAVLALVALRDRLGRPPWWALGIFAASPVAFMVSGFHGNVDSVMALGVLLAAMACAFNRPALCGLCLGLACQFKIIPLLLAPAFFFLWWQRQQGLRFSLTATLTMFVGWAYPLLMLPGVFIRNVLGYGSIWGVWGLPYALRLTDHPALRTVTFTETTPAQAAIMSGLKLIIVATVLALGWRRRKTPPTGIFQTLALTWAVFFVFAPGFGAQYLAWLAPCFLLSNPRWYVALTAASSVALFTFYTIISKGLPWYQAFTVHSIADQWAVWFALPWLVLASYLAWSVRAGFLPPKPEPVAGPSTS